MTIGIILINNILPVFLTGVILLAMFLCCCILRVVAEIAKEFLHSLVWRGNNVSNCSQC